VLEREGFKTSTAMDGEAAIMAFEKESPDLIILDLLLPNLDGFEVCRTIRKQSQVPILALSALNDQTEKVKCLDLGADDYLTKPFSMGELRARINALLRRSSKTIDSEKPVPRPFDYDDGYLKVDFQSHRVMVTGDEIILAPMEFKLLHELVINAGVVLEYNDLLSRVWGPEYRGTRDYLHDHIYSLRRKIEPDVKNPRYFITIPGFGYRFDGKG
jgi:two-component system KDP operon response regulator KdpE